jgi:hypothetical protein
VSFSNIYMANGTGIGFLLLVVVSALSKSFALLCRDPSLGLGFGFECPAYMSIPSSPCSSFLVLVCVIIRLLLLLLLLLSVYFFLFTGVPGWWDSIQLWVE